MRSSVPAPEFDLVSFVGIFWVVQEKGSVARLLEHRCSLTEAELYGEMLTCPHGHYDVWEQWRGHARPSDAGLSSVIALSEYEEWPRGRVVYNALGQRFILYADAQILQRASLLRDIHKIFRLPTDRTEAKTDEHYCSTRRIT